MQTFWIEKRFQEGYNLLKFIPLFLLHFYLRFYKILNFVIKPEVGITSKILNSVIDLERRQ